MLTHSQVLSKAEKRRKKKQEKAAAKALKAQQQPASFAAAPPTPSAPPVHPPTYPADPGLSSSGAPMPNQSASSANFPSAPETPAAIVTPPPPKGSSPQPAEPPTSSHKSSQQMTNIKPEGPQVKDVSHRGTPRSLPSSSLSPQGRRSSSRPFGVPVLKPPSASSFKVQTEASAYSAATATPPVKADMSPVPKGPHTPPEHATPRPSHSPPIPSALPAKHEPKGARTSAQLLNETVLPENGQQQQQQGYHNGKWTRQRTRRRRAQHGQKVQPNQPATQNQASSASVKTHAKQATRGNAHSSNIKPSQQQSRDIQRQAASNIADLPPKAAPLTEAADRHPHNIKPVNWAPQSYSAAVGPPPFGLMWSRLWWVTRCP